jgi:hypothetical protein
MKRRSSNKGRDEVEARKQPDKEELIRGWPSTSKIMKSRGQRGSYVNWEERQNEQGTGMLRRTSKEENVLVLTPSNICVKLHSIKG